MSSFLALPNLLPTSSANPIIKSEQQTSEQQATAVSSLSSMPEDEGVSIGAAASAVATGKAGGSSSASSRAAASSSALQAAREIAEGTRELKEGEPYPDLIKFPDEPPPPPELWEIEPQYDWERDERGYMFEDRIATAEEHKGHGNTHFHASEWELALRRYKRAIYFAGFDEMQMHDFMDHHRNQVCTRSGGSAGSVSIRLKQRSPTSRGDDCARGGARAARQRVERARAWRARARTRPSFSRHPRPQPSLHPQSSSAP